MSIIEELANVSFTIREDQKGMPGIYLEDTLTNQKVNITGGFLDAYTKYNFKLFKWIKTNTGKSSDYLQSSVDNLELEIFIINTQTINGKELLNLINQNKRQ